MQTFLPYPNFIESAKCLDNKRLGNQRVEAKQIIKVNLFKTGQINAYACKKCFNINIPDSDDVHIGNCKFCGHVTGFYDITNNDIEYLLKQGIKLKKIRYENHPAVLMWRGFEYSLAEYGWFICREWTNRGFKDNLMSFFTEIMQQIFDGTLPIDFSKLFRPDWCNDPKVRLSHQSNLVRKFPSHYRKYFPDVPNNLPYFWPVRKNK